MSKLRGKWGYFYEYAIKNENELKNIISKKFQTITYYGIKKEKIMKIIINNGILGVDRIVPIGYAHSMNYIWDGYNLIESLSRNIDCY